MLQISNFQKLFCCWLQRNTEALFWNRNKIICIFSVASVCYEFVCYEQKGNVLTVVVLTVIFRISLIFHWITFISYRFLMITACFVVDIRYARSIILEKWHITVSICSWVSFSIFSLILHIAVDLTEKRNFRSGGHTADSCKTGPKIIPQ